MLISERNVSKVIMVTDMGYLMFTFCMCHVNETLKDNIQATTKENNTAYDD
jgi:hypothetical protein